MRLFLLPLFFLFVSFVSYAQKDSITLRKDSITLEINKAKKVLEQKRIQFSVDHIEYHKAALDYAKIIYFDLDEWYDAEEYSRPSLSFIYDNYGKNSEEYKMALEKIPSLVGQVLTIEFDLRTCLKI